MSYTQQTWTTGEIITEEKLNHMEEGIANAGGGTVDVGYECSDPVTTTLFDGSVTTEGDEPDYPAYGDIGETTIADPETDTITLTLDGTEYTLNRLTMYGVSIVYAESIDETDPEDPVASSPSVWVSESASWGLQTASAGTYTVKIESTTETITTTECFGKAVSKTTGIGYEEGVITLFDESVTTVEDGDSAGADISITDPRTETITLSLDGAEYTLNRYSLYGQVVYAESLDETDPNSPTPSIPNVTMGTSGYIVTASAGTYDVKVDYTGTVAKTTKYFEKAINDIAGGGGSALENIIDAPNGGIIEGNVSENVATGLNAHSEGGGEGNPTTASGSHSHAEGYITTASGESSHAEGRGSVASGAFSHAENDTTHATGDYSHSEGQITYATGEYSHSEGKGTHADGEGSHAEGYGTTATHRSQHVFGEYNEEDPSTAAATAKGTYIEIVGNGTGSMSLSNARTLDWSGNEVLQGSLTLGKGTADETTITATQLKALIAML